MPFSNNISGFFYHQYIWSKTKNVLYFLNRGSYEEKITFKIVDWVWLGMPSHAQAGLNTILVDYP